MLFTLLSLAVVAVFIFYTGKGGQVMSVRTTVAIAMCSQLFIAKYMMVNELYPTAVRNVAVSAVSMMSRIGSMFSPQLFYLRFELLDDRPKIPHPTTVTTPDAVKAGREKIRQNPEKSPRKMVNDFNMSHKLIETTVNQKMYFHSYRKQKSAFLTKKIQLFRKEKGQLLLGGTLAIFKPFLQTKGVHLENHLPPKHKRIFGRRA
ncbi:unnamed protein product [Caenorhabditis nigoni]